MTTARNYFERAIERASALSGDLAPEELIELNRLLAIEFANAAYLRTAGIDDADERENATELQFRLYLAFVLRVYADFGKLGSDFSREAIRTVKSAFRQRLDELASTPKSEATQ